MDVQRVLCVKGGDGKDSYARNSLLQKAAMLKVKPILEESLTELYTSKFPEYFVMADLGCGSGPNTLLLVRGVIDIIRQNCRTLKTNPPIFQAFLNDLPSNDFNSIFNSLPSFYEKLERENGNEVGQCFVTATVGSFYGRLFPPNSLHFVHSSYCLHWQSKIPEELATETELARLNKWNICLGKNTDERVAELYSDLFKKDFLAFLRSRSAEMIEGGTMVLTLLGRQNETIPSSANQCFNIYELLERCFQEMALEIPEELATETELAKLNKWNICLGKNTDERVAELYSDLFKKDFLAFLRSRSAEMIEGGTMVLTLLGRQTKNQHPAILDLLAECLQDMAVEKEIEEAKADSFNIPFYKPTTAEIEGVIEREGLFSIRRLQTFEVNWDPRESSSFNRHARGEYVAMTIRAVTESMIASHFGHQILDGLFQRLAQKVEEYVEIGIGRNFNVVVSMTKSSSSKSNSSSFGAFTV